MPRRKRYDVFVSYSHKDAETVKPLIGVLSVAKRRVFWDEIIQPGQEWNHEIEAALAASDTIVIMWCCDSAASEWVAKEIAIARQLAKPLTPIRLCGFPLSGPVMAFQAIDLSGNLNHHCECARKPHGEQTQHDQPAKPSPLRLNRLLLGTPLPARRTLHFRPIVLTLSLAGAAYTLYNSGYWRIAAEGILITLAAAILLLAVTMYLARRAELRRQKTISLITDTLRKPNA